ncbi:DoxX family membrane protein [Candidatus Woesearchaeota archaeon]|nr:DoxX family membrane protein [Candidatus Woesearchaeota archaeon]
MLLYLIPGLRIVLGLLLVITGALKIPNLKGFSVIVASYGLLPRKLVKPLAYVQPFAEFVVGVWVLSGQYLFFASIAGLLLMLAADIFVLSALLKRKKLDNCGCYGIAFKIPLSWKKFIENLVWTGLFVLLLIGVS